MKFIADRFPALIAALALTAAPLPARAGSDALGIAGSWSVVSTFAASTCGKPYDTGGTDAYSWLVSMDASGAYSVAVQGATAYPRLTGKADGIRLRVSGFEHDGLAGGADAIAASDGGPFSDMRAAYRLGRSDFTVTVTDGVMSGTRTLMLVEGPLAAAAGQGPPFYSACRLEYAVRATRN